MRKDLKITKEDIKEITKGIEKRAERALKALANANKGKYAEKTGCSRETLDRINDF